MFGVKADGTKELVALEDGCRESWASVLRDRGLRAVAVGDGTLGFWWRCGTYGRRRCRRATGATRWRTCWTSVVVSELSRLGRSLGQIVAVFDALAKAGVAFVALKEAFPRKRTRVGPNWGRRGTVKIAIENEAGTGWIKMKVDYRQAGSMPGMPDKVPTAKCEVTHGICIYRGGELAHRKLNTITGEKPRMKARDIYDAGWLAAERPDLIDSEDRRKLKDWLNGLPDSSKNALN